MHEVYSKEGHVVARVDGGDVDPLKSGEKQPFKQRDEGIESNDDD